MRIAVYTLGKGRARPDYYISQADALERIRLNDAERAGKHAIVMLSVKRPSHSRPTLNNWYIPENMPPVDLPGLRFIPPRSRMAELRNMLAYDCIVCTTRRPYGSEDTTPELKVARTLGERKHLNCATCRRLTTHEFVGTRLFSQDVKYTERSNSQGLYERRVSKSVFANVEAATV